LVSKLHADARINIDIIAKIIFMLIYYTTDHGSWNTVNPSLDPYQRNIPTDSGK